MNKEPVMIAVPIAFVAALVVLSGCTTVPAHEDRDEPTEAEPEQRTRRIHLVLCDGTEDAGSHLVDCITPLPGPVI